MMIDITQRESSKPKREGTKSTNMLFCNNIVSVHLSISVMSCFVLYSLVETPKEPLSSLSLNGQKGSAGKLGISVALSTKYLQTNARVTILKEMKHAPFYPMLNPRLLNIRKP
ncbi:hypothetical protein EYC84_008546 [Monilinia fructicola]|uniref:Uncharacterized protein n=1 Tax=Monilinia fructicola TaxID=38448 RepID=A0A5M9JEY5_MONFR|nr:hypothetical protein EYC84_008546 [Monilinia fructicola]